MSEMEQALRREEDTVAEKREQHHSWLLSGAGGCVPPWQ